MKLSTEVHVSKVNKQLNYDSKILCLGSCFAEHISDKLKYFKFQVTSNPFGILFHPQAIVNSLEKALEDNEFSTDEVFQNSNKWHSFFSHSRLSKNSSEEILAALNSASKELQKASQQASHIIITLGTSFIYKHKSSGQYVANCHKLPQDQFEKELTSVSDLKDILGRLMSGFERLKPGVQLIFTISPVRHIKDGVVENQRSKAHLISALHSVLEEKNSLHFYFPSYELMMDELRDYRFYDRDLIHPNALAVDLIWEKFKMAFISEDIYADMIKVDKLQKSIAHRTSENRSEAFEKLKAYQNKLMEELQANYPLMNFEGL